MGGQTSSGDVTYAYHNTNNANNSNLAQSYHINDNLEANLIPSNMLQSGVVNTQDEVSINGRIFIIWKYYKHWNIYKYRRFKKIM